MDFLAWRENTRDIFYSYLGPRNVVAQLGNFYILFSGFCLKKSQKVLRNLDKRNKRYHCDETSSSTFTNPYTIFCHRKVFVKIIN